MNQKNIVKDIQSKLFDLQDIKYRDFHAKLMPTVNKEKIIGVPAPVNTFRNPLSALVKDHADYFLHNTNVEALAKTSLPL